jgi:uncharacterized membrane protein YecN with MAPEG domain
MSVTLPVWTLLLFAVWTVLSLAASVGVYRWSRILRGRSKVSEFGAYAIEGEQWYQRSLRAHANGVENLPVYGAIVLFIAAAGLRSSVLDVLAIVVLCGRVAHTLTHIAFTQTGKVVAVRFTFFALQIVCMLAMAAIAAFSMLE